jgi:uncharacterized protein YndB with AHSA1/START domain
METIEKSIDIDAPKEKVWAVLLEDTYNKDWLSVFSEGTRAKTDWIEGHKVRFTDKAGNGIVGRVLEKKPYEKLVFEYDGMLVAGNEDYDSDAAKSIKDARETYCLSDYDGRTRLKIASDIDDAHYGQMERQWEAALQRIAELAHAV